MEIIWLGKTLIECLYKTSQTAITNSSFSLAKHTN
jgi:hypothetical protein